jgi:hypothetical protein
MNGKQAKLLRKMSRADKKSKRLFNAMDHSTKGSLRKSVNDYISYVKAIEAASADVVAQTSELVVDGGVE